LIHDTPANGEKRRKELSAFVPMFSEKKVIIKI
jgi:hypothetical protein